MDPSGWDLAPKCVGGPTSIFCLIGESPILSAARIEMFVTWISFRGTFQSFWDLTEVSAQSWYKVRNCDLLNHTFEISLV